MTFDRPFAENNFGFESANSADSNSHDLQQKSLCEADSAVNEIFDVEITHTTKLGSQSPRGISVSRVLLRLHRWTGADKYAGWRFGVYSGVWISSLVLLSNTILLVWGAVRSKDGSSIGTIAEGSPQYTSRISTAYHVLINVLATLLLSASNYCMQILCAPTREEIDQAHRKGISLHVGLQSLGNLRYVATDRAIVWWVLLLSSFPLHLFYNSTISDVTVGQEYYIRFGRSDDADFNKQFEKLENDTLTSVLREYDYKYVPGHRDLYLLVDAVSLPVVWNHANGAFQQYNANASTGIDGRYDVINLSAEMYDDLTTKSPGIPPIDWSLSMLVKPVSDQTWRSFISADQQGWVMTNMDVTGLGVGYHVLTAAGDQADDGSKVQIALPFMAVVVASNLAKVIAMWYVLRRMNRDVLVTTGDAIQSFLQRPDTHTIGHCMSSEQEIKRCLAPLPSRLRASSAQRRLLVQKKSQNRKTQWDRSNKLTLLILLFISWTIAPTMAVIAFVSDDTRDVATSLWSWGPASQLIAGGLVRYDALGVLYNTWLANMPQVLLSSAYFYINRCLTRYASSLEWIQWAETREYLRVSRPQGQQRGTHFLQLPYKIAIPMVVYSGLLHWLLSQALFLRRLELKSYDGTIIEDASTCTVGYSPLSVLVLVVVALVGTVCIAVQIWLLKPRSDIPYGANNSLVISAACHPPPNDVDACIKAVQWGVVADGNASTSTQHCTFTSKEVYPVASGEDYA